jgi:microcompartment protein CcmK/EutM
MFIARVRGNIVTTQKVETMTGRKLLIVEPMRVDEKQKKLYPTDRCFVAVDSVGAGTQDLVLVTQGSSARMTGTTEKSPVDCVIIGIIDTVFADGAEAYRKDAARAAGPRGNDKKEA